MVAVTLMADMTIATGRAMEEEAAIEELLITRTSTAALNGSMTGSNSLAMLLARISTVELVGTTTAIKTIAIMMVVASNTLAKMEDVAQVDFKIVMVRTDVKVLGVTNRNT